MIPEKECSRCHEVKALYHFTTGSTNGYRTYCRACKYKGDEITRKARAEARAEKDTIARNALGPRQTSVFAITRPYDHTARAICPRCKSYMVHNGDGDFGCLMCGRVEYYVAQAKAETT